MDATGVNNKSKKDLYITAIRVLGVSENYLGASKPYVETELRRGQAPPPSLTHTAFGMTDN